MNTIALGLDVVEVERVAKALDRTPGFATRIFTPNEIEYCEGGVNRAERYAARWAAKEAVIKALGAEIPSLDFHDIEVRKLPSGAPEIFLGGAAHDAAKARGIAAWLVSLSHTTTVAHAVVIGLGNQT